LQACIVMGYKWTWGTERHIWGYAFMPLKRWATRDLRHGDLTTLSAIAKGSLIDETDASIERLKRRHFVFVKPDGQITLSFKGQMALMIRRRMRRR